MRASARQQRRKGGNQLGPEAEEEGMGFKVQPITVIIGSMIFIAVTLVSHIGMKFIAG